MENLGYRAERGEYDQCRATRHCGSVGFVVERFNTPQIAGGAICEAAHRAQICPCYEVGLDSQKEGRSSLFVLSCATYCWHHKVATRSAKRNGQIGLSGSRCEPEWFSILSSWAVVFPAITLLSLLFPSSWTTLTILLYSRPDEEFHLRFARRTLRVTLHCANLVLYRFNLYDLRARQSTSGCFTPLNKPPWSTTALSRTTL
ncbi:hypothetical protein B0H16DRAFT_1516586 [Mycena metata]|uniref:Uncharacterized protein n=1 Tax=Mycena metata TaxID=1033252 RepID=A0AAD7JSW9_9AGAR|nr:hypothetical protein B0H16DRAFT_1516586 [Mycena metata]